MRGHTMTEQWKTLDATTDHNSYSQYPNYAHHYVSNSRLAKQYGNVYTIWAGNLPVVVLSGFKAVKEGLINHSECFDERPVTPFFKTLANEMAKVHKEIDDVLGSSPSFEYQDHKNLPYTMAVIHEILRAHSIFFVGLPRQCIMDVNLLGFFIPKGTYIILDIDSVLLDPKIWEAPTEFYPNHFLDKEGRFVEREQLLAFGAGPRVCIGKQLARIELFVFFTSLLRRFTFQLPEGVKENNKGYSGGFLKTAPLYKFCAVPRYTAA
uniref:Uncharacterized protein n=1 Tax=Sphaerodactylus townsendi TaxID=933632 RepID=A0ACB8FCX9_9SAUR